MLTNKELKEMLKTREPVFYWNTAASVGGEWREYAYVCAVITRYNSTTRKYEIMVEIMDKSQNGIVVAPPKYLKRAETEADKKGRKENEDNQYRGKSQRDCAACEV